MKPVRQLIEHRPNVYSIAPSDSVFDAIKRMAEQGIGALLVLDGERLAGIVSERDYARKVVLQGRGSRETSVRDIMTSKVITTTLDARAKDCMQLMTQNRIRHLPVVDEAGNVVGMLSIGDLLKAVIEHLQLENEQLSAYINS